MSFFDRFPIRTKVFGGVRSGIARDGRSRPAVDEPHGRVERRRRGNPRQLPAEYPGAGPDPVRHDAVPTDRGDAHAGVGPRRQGARSRHDGGAEVRTRRSAPAIRAADHARQGADACRRRAARVGRLSGAGCEIYRSVEQGRPDGGGRILHRRHALDLQSGSRPVGRGHQAQYRTWNGGRQSRRRHLRIYPRRHHGDRDRDHHRRLAGGLWHHRRRLPADDADDRRHAASGRT